MTVFERYYGFMENYTDFYRQVRAAESEKLEALLSNDIDRIGAAMKEYQSYIKKAQQMEHERIDLCKELGFENMAFSHIVSHFEGEEKEKITEQKNVLNDIVSTIKYFNRKSIEFVNMQLSYVEGESSTYNAKGQTDAHLANSNLLNKQI